MTRWGHSIERRKQAELDYVAVRSILSYLVDKLIYLKDKSIRRLVNNSQRPLLEIRLTERTVTLQAIPILPGSDRGSVPEISGNADLYLLVEVDWERRTATLIGFSEQVHADFSRRNFQRSKQGLFDALKRLFNSEDAAPSSEVAGLSSESVTSLIAALWQRWLNFVGKTGQVRRQAISALQFESTKPKFHSWVLEPQLTPSAIVGRLGGLDPWGDDLQFDGFDGDGLPEVSQFSEGAFHDASTAESVSVNSIDGIEVVPTIASSLDPVSIADDEIDWHSAADMAEQADMTAGEEPAPLLDSVFPDSSEPIAAALNPDNAIPISSGVFSVDSSGQVTFEFIHDGGEYAGEVAIFSLEGMDPASFGTAEFNYEAASRALGLSASGSGHVVISDITQGAALDTQFNDGVFLGLQSFAMTPGDRFGIMLVPNGSIQQLYDSYHTVDDNYDAVDVIFSMEVNQEDGNLVAVLNQDQVFGFEDLGDVYTGDCDDIIFRMTGTSGSVPQYADYSNEVLDSIQGYIDANPISPPATLDTPPTSPELPPTSVDPSPPASPPDVPSNPPNPGTPVDPGTPDSGTEDATAPLTSVESPPAVSPESPTEVSRLPEAHSAPALAIDSTAAPPPLSNPTLPESANSLVADTAPRATLATVDAGATGSLSLTSSNLSDLLQAPEADPADVTTSSLPWESIAKALPDIGLLTLPADSLLPSLTETVQFIVVLEVFSRLLATNSSLSYRQLRSLLGWTETGIKATGTRLRGDED